MNEPVVDWTPFARYAPNEIACECGALYRSHSKLVNWEGKLTLCTEQPCPQCGAKHGHVRRASSPKESMTLGPKDVRDISP